MSKLSDTQLVILASAAARPNHAVLPPPEAITLSKAALAKVINSLLSRALIAETPASKGGATWREDEGQRFALAITTAGLEAIGVDVGDHPHPPVETDDQPVTGRASPRQGSSKLAAVLTLLLRPEGASITDMNEVTNWQAHSTPAFLSGLRKKGMAITRTKDEAGKAIYTLHAEFQPDGQEG